mgnify:CR=1 FL=1
MGLGNPGSKYAHTRHNAGFDVVSILAERMGVSMRTHAYKARIGRGELGGRVLEVVDVDEGPLLRRAVGDGHEAGLFGAEGPDLLVADPVARRNR